MRACGLAIAIAVAVAFAFAFARPAAAIERTFAGSAQLDYLFVPTAKDADANAGTGEAFDGFTLEASLKLAVDLTEHLSANVKVCYGCHGFEADMVYFDLRAFDELNFRLGRFSPGFGAFNLRHDPANEKLSDKPLAYDMGRMLRNTTWNAGVIPSPFPDNGLEIDGTHWFGEKGQFDYAVYAVAGFRTTGANVTDIDFNESRETYYVDNNARPTGGARLALTLKPTKPSDVSFGLSGMAGTYDDENKLLYAIVGADLAVRVDRTNFRMEYLIRRTYFDTGDPATFKYPIASVDGNFFTKQGAYAEIEQPLAKEFDLVGRVDGLARFGNVPLVVEGVPVTSELTSQSWMLRETLGLAYAVERNLRLKSSVEYYQYSDPDVNGHKDDVAIHLGVTGTF